MQFEVSVLQTEVREPQLAQLLKEYVDMFEESKPLPPHRSHDHGIVLRKGTSPINVRLIVIRYYRKM